MSRNLKYVFSVFAVFLFFSCILSVSAENSSSDFTAVSAEGYDLLLYIPTEMGYFEKMHTIETFPFEIPIFTKPGFVGWSCSKDKIDIFSESVLTKEAYDKLPDPKSLYAVFDTSPSIEKYSVRYVGIADDLSNRFVSVPTDSSLYEKNAVFGIKFDVVPFVHHSEFLGWTRDPMAEYADFEIPKNSSEVQTSRIQNDTTLYAVWNPGVHIITYDLDGGTGADTPPSQVGVHKKIINLPKLPRTANKHGAKFDGWFCEQVNKKYEPDSRFMMVNRSVCLKAVWKDASPIPPDSVRLVFKTYNDRPDMVYHACKNSLFELPKPPVRRGFLFLGWKTSLGNFVEVTDANQIRIGSDDTVLTAEWKKLPNLSENTTPSIIDAIIFLQYIGKTGTWADIPETDLIDRGFDLNNNHVIDLGDVLIYMTGI